MYLIRTILYNATFAIRISLYIYVCIDIALRIEQNNALCWTKKIKVNIKQQNDSRFIEANQLHLT